MSQRLPGQLWCAMYHAAAAKTGPVQARARQHGWCRRSSAKQCGKRRRGVTERCGIQQGGGGDVRDGVGRSSHPAIRHDRLPLGPASPKLPVTSEQTQHAAGVRSHLQPAPSQQPQSPISTTTRGIPFLPAPTCWSSPSPPQHATGSFPIATPPSALPRKGRRMRHGRS